MQKLKSILINHGTAIAKENIGEIIKKGDAGIITAYLPEDDTFAVFFDDNKWYTFHESEQWFLDNFEVIKEETASYAMLHIKQRCLLFANWLRINFDNSPHEIDNHWEDTFYTVDKITRKNYTTEELYEWWSNNVA